MTTARLTDWFEKEAGDCISALAAQTDSLDEEGTLDRMRATIRTLGGAARVAGEDRLSRVAHALGHGLGRSSASADLESDIRLTIEDLRQLLDHGEPDGQLEARADAAVARWTSDGPDDSQPAAESAPAAFLAFVTAEISGIADVMEQGVAAFGEDPSNREWLGAILRRQRSLLGSARLNEIPVLPEALYAVEDLCELIVRLDVPVKSEWLDVFRCARDVLRAAGGALEEGEEPGQTPALSRLRTLHEELTARYGERVAAQAAEAGEAAAGAETGVPIADPRQRAAVLRAGIARALDDNADARRSLDELYALLMDALR